MLHNFLKSTWRNLTKNKMSSFINIGGLTMGIAVAFLIGLWIYDELSFNKVHQNYKRIGRILTRGTDPKDGPYVNTSLTYPLATELMTNYKSNFNHIVRASWTQEYILSAGEKKLSRIGQFFDRDAPEMLTLKMKEGARSGLSDPHSLLLAASTATALFGQSPALGQSILLNNKTAMIVGGVYEDLPQNSEFADVKFLGPWDRWVAQNDWIEKRASQDWTNHFLRLYAEIQPGSSFTAVNDHIKDVELIKMTGIENYKEEVSRHPEVFIHPMAAWHLQPIDRNSAQPGKGPMKMLFLVGTIGIFILILACINFMNLSTARAENRAREVGIRKTIGSARKQIIIQFYGESLIVVLLSFVLACILVAITIPWFNQLAGKQMHIPWTDIYFWLVSSGFILITGLLAGSYPALYLSSFRPVKVLKGTFRTGRFASLPRKVMVVLQFIISVALIISTIVINRQVLLGKNRPVGYDQKGLIMIEMKSEDFNNKYSLFRSAFLNTGVVANLSESMGKVTEVASGNNGFDWKGKDPKKEESFGTLAVTPDHGKTIGWDFVQGRDFSGDIKSDSAGVVINEAAARYMELNQPVGETITWKWKDNAPQPYTVLGVIRDAVMESPYQSVEPTLFFIKALNGGVNWINMRIRPGIPFNTALAKIEATFKKLIPSAPFDYKFVDQEYAKKFESEERVAGLVGFFAAIAIGISCLGLFGLATFVAGQRTKEIGVRKVLGASVMNLWGLLSREFIVLVAISLLAAGPIAYYYMHQWLESYPYRVGLGWQVFVIAGACAMGITLLTVSIQTIRIALANPVRSLRSE